MTESSAPKDRKYRTSLARSGGESPDTGRQTALRDTRVSPPALSWRQVVSRFIIQYAVLLTLGALILLFSLLRPDSFATVDNWHTVLRLASPGAVLALGLTVVLAAGDFDLSFAGMMNVTGAITVLLMVSQQFSPFTAILAGVLIGAILGGLLNGLPAAYMGTSSFIITLATGQILTGSQFILIDNRAVFQGIPQSFTSMTIGLNVVAFPAVLAALLYLLMHRMEGGRYIYAIGMNRQAAYYAGLRVRWWRLLSFAIVGACAALAAILISSQSAAVTPDFGASYLIPAYAAVFLGSVAFHPVRFTILGTLVGIIFLQVLQTGLAMMYLPGSAILIIQGGVLAGAILFSRIGKRDLL